MSCPACAQIPLDATIGAASDLRRVVRSLRVSLNDGTLVQVTPDNVVADLEAGRAKGEVSALFRCTRCRAHYRLAVDLGSGRGSFDTSDEAA